MPNGTPERSPQTAARRARKSRHPASLTFRADEALIRAVKARAVEDDRSESSVVRAAVRAFLDAPAPATVEAR